MEAHVISFSLKIQVLALCWKAYVDGVLGLPRMCILEHYMEKGVTVTSVYYCNMLRNELRLAICSKRRGRLTRCSAVTRQCTPSYGTPHHQHHSATKLGSSRAPCLQPRPGPFRFLFGPLKNALRGRRFAADDEVNKKCMTGFADNHKLSFLMALRSLKITGINVSRRREIILKSNAVLMSVT